MNDIDKLREEISNICDNCDRREKRLSFCMNGGIKQCKIWYMENKILQSRQENERLKKVIDGIEHKLSCLKCMTMPSEDGSWQDVYYQYDVDKIREIIQESKGE